MFASATSSVADRALVRACYVLRFLLADRTDIRQAFYKSYGRVAIIAGSDVIGDIPEYQFLPSAYNKATRGLGAIPAAPVSTAGEENVLCETDDPHEKEDILLREIAVGIYQLAAKKVDGQFRGDLERQYERAMASRWWRNTYAERSPEAYFVSTRAWVFFFRLDLVLTVAKSLYYIMKLCKHQQVRRKLGSDL